jgi:hypothetical protein
MDHFSIQTGKTRAHFRYIGIQPPLSEEHAEALAEVTLPDGMRSISADVITPEQGGPYTEFGFATAELADPDTAVMQVAHDIAAALRNDTTEVTVHESEVLPVGLGRYLFGGQDNQLG